MELRAARLTLQTASADRERAQTALKTAIAEGALRRDRAGARLAALKKEKRELEQRLEDLAARLEKKKKEDAVLARGAALRDQYVDWNGSNPMDRERKGDGLSVQEVKLFAFMLIAAFMFLFVILWVAKR